MIKNLTIILLTILLSFNASATTRIKDIAGVEGVRENLLVGHGLVVGLSGSGDNLKNTVDQTISETTTGLKNNLSTSISDVENNLKKLDNSKPIVPLDDTDRDSNQ